LLRVVLVLRMPVADEADDAKRGAGPNACAVRVMLVSEMRSARQRA
jgi:hypothetical protein